jgi:O-antigen/teichoic acid export membrane protein
VSGTLFPRALHALFHQKLTRDITYSIGGFAVLAASGVVINLVVSVARDAAALGMFNLAYAVYIIVSQFAVWGIHYSVLRHTAFYKDLPRERGSMLCTAVALALALGALAVALTVWAEPFFAQMFSSVDTGHAIRNAAFGLLLFPVNKVLLAYLNGLRQMKAFSILQALRYSVIMAVVSGVAVSSVSMTQATLAFFVAELATTLAACIALIRLNLFAFFVFSKPWVRRHLTFGSKGLMAGMFAEVNSRVDVLLIGFFLTDRATGIYSFAAMLADGLYQLLTIVRINFNPILVAAVKDGDWTGAKRLRQQAGTYVRPIMLGLSTLLVGAFYGFTTWAVPGKGLQEGLPVLLILLAGLNVIAILVPFDNLLMVSGHPAYQTAQQMATVAANAIVAAVLLPMMGVEGAAVGTAASYLCGIAMLVFFANRLLRWNLIINQTKV